MRQSPDRGFFIEGLTEKLVTGPKNIRGLLERARNRIENQMKKRAGVHGHAVFTISCTQLDEDR